MAKRPQPHSFSPLVSVPRFIGTSKATAPAQGSKVLTYPCGGSNTNAVKRKKPYMRNSLHPQYFELNDSPLEPTPDTYFWRPYLAPVINTEPESLVQKIDGAPRQNLCITSLKLGLSDPTQLQTEQRSQVVSPTQVTSVLSRPI